MHHLPVEAGNRYYAQRCIAPLAVDASNGVLANADLQRETNEANIERNSRRGIRSRLRRWESCCYRLERVVKRGRDDKRRDNGWILYSLDLSQYREVVRAKLQAGGRSTAVRSVMTGDHRRFALAWTPHISKEAAGVGYAHEDGE